MMSNQKNMADLQALERHLDVYGADQTRWPPETRQQFTPLLVGDSRARASLEEARALDRLLDRAPVPSGCRQRALRDRILAAISNDRVGVCNTQPAARVIALPPRRQSRTRTAAPRIGSRAAALLAAALVMGIYLGTAGGLTPEAQVVMEVVGLQTEPDPSQLSLLDENGPLSEEDLL
jgi:hypothetical protein